MSKIKHLGVFLLMILISRGVVAETLPTVVRENFKMVLSATQQGPIQLYVKQGDFVAEGDKLFGMTVDELQVKLNLAKIQWQQAQASERKIRNPHTDKQLQYAKSKFDQQDGLYRSGGISPDAYNIAKLEYDLATQKNREEDIAIASANVKAKQYQMELTEIALEKATSVAAADARVHLLLVQPNEWVRPGQEILVLININPLNLVVNVPLKSIAKVQMDKPLKIMVSTGLQEVQTQGVVKYISDEVDAVSQTVPVRIEIDNEKRVFKPGMRAQVVLP